MCGIVYLHNFLATCVSESVRKRYETQKTRGTDGFGFICYDLINNRIKKVRRKTTEAGIMKELEKANSNAILFHHRFPTSTPNVKEASHPITVRNDELDHVYYVVHNGIISNDEDMYKIHKGLGYDYTTEIQKCTTYETIGKTYETKTSMFNDSEALAIELARYIDGKASTMDAKGSIAFVVLQANKRGVVKKVYFGRNASSPLGIEVDTGMFSIRSEGGKEIEPQKLFCFDYATNETTMTDMYIGSWVGYTSYPDSRFDSAYDRDEYNYGGYHKDTITDWKASDFLEDSLIAYSIDELLTMGYSYVEISKQLDEERWTLETIRDSAEQNRDYKEVKLCDEMLEVLDGMAEEVSKRIVHTNTKLLTEAGMIDTDDIPF